MTVKTGVSLSSITVKAYLNLLLTNEKPMHALMIFFGSLAVFTSIHFYPIPMAVIMAMIAGYIAYVSKPQFGVIAFMLAAMPAFAYQSTEFFWLYLIPFAILLFKLWDYWDMVVSFQLLSFIPFAPFPISLLSGFVYFVFVVSSLYQGSKRTIPLVLIALYLIMLLSGLWQVSSPYFPTRIEMYRTMDALERQQPVSFEEFPLAVKMAISHMTDFKAALNLNDVLSVVWYNSAIMIGNDTYIIQAIILAVVLYIIAWIPGRVRGKFIEVKASLALLLLIPSYLMFYSFIREPFPLEIPAYILASIGLIYLFESQGFRFSRELEIRKKKEEKYFGKFGLQELTLSKGERGLDDIGGYEDVKAELKEALLVPLQKPEIAYAYGLKPPRGILLFGPPGTGKTMLMRAFAKEIDYPFFYVKTSEILSHLYGETEKNLSEVFETARKRAPAILFFDEIDAIAKSRTKSQDDVTPRVLSTLLQELDGFKENKPVIFVAATNVPDMLDPAILRPGRIDKVIYMRLPNKEERKAIFKVHTRDLPLADDVDFDKLAELTERFSGADIANVVVETKRLVAEKAKKELKIIPMSMADFKKVIKKTKPSTSLADLERYEKFKLEFERRMGEEKEKEAPELTFKDVADMEDIKSALKDSIEIPLKHPELIKKYEITPPKGLLLFGPPGTGKTYIVKAAAGEFGIPMFFLSGADLLREGYTRASSLLKETFNQAKENAPSIIFIDELETVVPVRSTGAQPLTGQLLQEMDGVKDLGNVLVIGATNLPYEVDPALLRPGRFDKIIYVGLPNKEVRKEIFKLHLDKFSEYVDLDKLAEATPRYSPADIADICKKVKYSLLKKEVSGEKPELKTEDVLEIIKKTKPSVPPKMLMVYRKFMDFYGERK